MEEGKPKVSLSFKSRSVTRPATVDLFPSKEEQDDISPMDDGNTEKVPDDEPWLQAGLVVCILNDTLAEGRYYRRTGIVRRVIDTFGGEVHVGNDILKLDQDDLQTVIPEPSEYALVITGQYQDLRVKIIGKSQSGREVEVEIDEGPKTGHYVLLPLSNVCKHIAVSK
jgi:hypothetical protein